VPLPSFARGLTCPKSERKGELALARRVKGKILRRGIVLMSIATDANPTVLAPSARIPIFAGLAIYLAMLALGWWVLSVFMPDRLNFDLAGHGFIIRNIHDKILGNATLLLLILPFALWLEYALVGWEGCSFRDLLAPSASIKTDIAFLALDQAHLMGLVSRVMMLGASLISGVALRDWLQARTGYSIDTSYLPLWLQILVYFHVYSFFDYWAHRLGHTHWFWPLHRYHHAAKDFCVVNAARNHPAGFAGIFLINIPMPLLGASQQAMIWVNVATIALGFAIHSRIQSDWGWVGRCLLQSPAHHRLHHKLDMSQPTGFFGMIPLWDHLFGGWSKTATQADVAIGVDTVYRHGFWLLPDLLRDYCDFWKGLVGRRILSPSERASHIAK
jgi:sterol desaturase/sphingolipid hydroxylase (fatty acid hydroxylase superfamily)